MKYLSWSELEVLTLKDSIEFDGAWALSKDKIDRENKDRRYGSLINNKNSWNLSLYQSLTHSTKSLDKKLGNRYSPSKALEIYGVNFNGLYVKLIDAYESEDIVSPNFTDLHQQKLGMKTVIIYRDSKSLAARYTDVLVSFDNINDYLMQIFNCESQYHKYNENHILCDKKYICRISYKGLKFDIFIVRKNESKIFFDIKFDTYISNLDDISSMIIKLKRGLSLYYKTRLEPEYIYLTNENNDLARVFLPMDIDYINGFKNYDIDPIYSGAITLNTLKAVISGMFNKVYKNKLLNGFVTHNYNIIVNYLDTDHKLIDLTQAIENLYADKKEKKDNRKELENVEVVKTIRERKNNLKIILKKLEIKT
ncbi:hypothetical protein [Lactobacillus sp. LL6]|uniref:hypothetical protein n=1 Tax=Lactobacillus sp. LL6 TaxID=2596827 RepID=UPI001185B5D9|nr:hypothetical protein [Lactobacillus sp. LL6]TSO25479.1 hypothetical protein FOD82_09650 [Lactobacillus sp. LL6]